ncbi:MAG: MarR family winged helix-turn-helix transcriptional regulator [Acidobacteriia bacterium]|nr:MarR family winged helix-turn-helix transcriptional regulator [Terriglobia bacterium]
MPVKYSAIPKRVPPVGVAFLLSQVGAHAANSFEERLVAMELKPHHAGLLRMLGSNPGLSQQELCDVFGIFPSRLVVLLDQLEARRLIERRDNSADRRGHRVYLTKAGRTALTGIGKQTLALETDLCAALTGPERATLASLLTRIVAQQNIMPAVHPAYRNHQKRRNR